MTDATLNRYVNDAIGFGMNPEQMLYYSDNCFGTADALSFKNNVLRIHDLKTGILEAKVEQLEVYAALFCLEYHVSPMDIEISLRFYQNDAVQEFTTDVTAVMHIMSQIIHFDTLINKIRSEALA